MRSEITDLNSRPVAARPDSAPDPLAADEPASPPLSYAPVDAGEVSTPAHRRLLAVLPGGVKQRWRDNEVAQSLLFKSSIAEHRLRRGHAVRRRTIRRYLASTPEPKLQIGAGTYPLPGWLNSDVVSGDVHLDITRRIDVPDAAFEYAFGEHVIEHVTESAGRRALAELHRVLRPGGVLRLTTPDLRRLIAIYEDRNPAVSLADYAGFLDSWTSATHERACQVLNAALRYWGHRYVYDEEDLTAKLREAGFAQVERLDSGESRHPALRGLERHGPDWLNAAEAMCLEATKPG